MPNTCPTAAPDAFFPDHGDEWMDRYETHCIREIEKYENDLRKIDLVREKYLKGEGR